MIANVDLFIAIALSVFAAIAVLADSINLLAGIGFVSDSTLSSLPHPQVVKSLFLSFSSEVDPLLRLNPPWFYAMMILNLGHVAFYLFAVPRILRKQDVRGPALFWCGSMLTILFVITFEEFMGPAPTRDPLRFTAAYGSYMVVPLVVLKRFWNDEKHETKLKRK